MTKEEKKIYEYRLARAALALGYSLGEQGVYAGVNNNINLNKIAKYVLKIMDNMEIPLNGLKAYKEYMSEES